MEELRASAALTAMLLRHCPRPLRASSELQRLLNVAERAQGTLKARLESLCGFHLSPSRLAQPAVPDAGGPHRVRAGHASAPTPSPLRQDPALLTHVVGCLTEYLEPLSLGGKAAALLGPAAEPEQLVRP